MPRRIEFDPKIRSTAAPGREHGGSGPSCTCPAAPWSTRPPTRCPPSTLATATRRPRHQPGAVRADLDPSRSPVTLHLRSAFLCGGLGPSQAQVSVTGQALPCIWTPCRERSRERGRLDAEEGEGLAE